MKQLGLSLLLVMLLGGCSFQQRDRVYYMRHPQQMVALLKTCKATPSADCKEASAAKQQLQQLAKIFRKNPEAFGQELLKIQTQMATLKSKLEAKPTTKLKQRYQQLVLDVDSRLAFLYLVDSERHR